MSRLISNDSPLSFHEFVMDERLPLAEIHQVILRFLRSRTDTVLFGAQAVNAYVEVTRMTQGVDVMATAGEALSAELCKHIHDQLKIAVRVRSIANGKGYRIYQLRSPSNRHLVDVRQVEKLPEFQLIDDIQVVDPVSLLALKVVSMTERPNSPKGLTDQADLMRMLITFPQYKSSDSPVLAALERISAKPIAHQAWRELVTREIQPDADDEY
jgi:hypothetical protein